MNRTIEVAQITNSVSKSLSIVNSLDLTISRAPSAAGAPASIPFPKMPKCGAKRRASEALHGYSRNTKKTAHTSSLNGCPAPLISDATALGKIIV